MRWLKNWIFISRASINDSGLKDIIRSQNFGLLSQNKNFVSKHEFMPQNVNFVSKYGFLPQDQNFVSKHEFVPQNLNFVSKYGYVFSKYTPCL